MWRKALAGTAKADFRLDGDAFHGGRCQKITFLSGEGTAGIDNMGLNRWGMALAAGKPYEGKVYLRADGEAAAAFALLDDEGKPAAGQEVTVRGGWKPYAVSLTPARPAARGRFAILLDRPGTVWADMAFLQPGPWGRFRDLPVRRDIAEGLLREGLTVLRLGGWMINAPEYRWKSMIGPRESRPEYRGNWYPHSTNGWGIIDFLDLCERSGYLAVAAVNIEETPADAMDFVEYVNGGPATEWGRRRALDGHPRPYDLRHVQIGNEETLNDHYVERFRILSDAMAARDPGLTFIIAAWFDEKNPASRRLVELSRGKKVLWDIHVGGDGLRDADRDGKAIERIRDLFTQWCPEAGVKTCILEENGGRHDIQRALGHAHMVNTMERLGDFVLIDCPANCLQPWKQNDNGWDQGQLFFTPGMVWGMPPYYAQQMIAAARQPRCVTAEVAAPMDALDVTATRSEDGRTVVLKVVNLEGEAVPARIVFEGFAPRSTTALVSVLAGALDARNSPEEPEKIVPREAAIEASPEGFRPVFPPHSFTVIRFE